MCNISAGKTSLVNTLLEPPPLNLAMSEIRGNNFVLSLLFIQNIFPFLFS